MAEQRARHDAEIDPRILPGRGRDGDEGRNRQGQEDGRDLDLQGLPAPGDEHAADRLVVDDAGAEIEVEDVPEPDGVARRRWLIEAVIAAHRLDRLGRDARPFGKQDLDWIADGVDDEEDDQADAEDEPDREDQPSYNVTEDPHRNLAFTGNAVPIEGSGRSRGRSNSTFSCLHNPWL